MLISSVLYAADERVYVVNNGWHTGLAIPAHWLQQPLPQLRERFGEVSYLEIGWGDKGFYQASEITATITLKAMLGLSGSIIHIVAIPGSPREYFAKSEVTTLCLTPTQLATLSQTLIASFARTEQRITPLGKGLYGNSEFYAAVGNYHLFHTCNSWTAQSLASTGLDISPRFKLTANSVMKAVAPLACAN